MNADHVLQNENPLSQDLQSLSQLLHPLPLDGTTSLYQVQLQVQVYLPSSNEASIGNYMLRSVYLSQYYYDILYTCCILLLHITTAYYYCILLLHTTTTYYYYAGFLLCRLFQKREVWKMCLWGLLNHIEGMCRVTSAWLSPGSPFGPGAP